MGSAEKNPVFRDSEADWDSYQERLECFFLVNETVDDKKVGTLIIRGLSAIQYQTLKNLLTPIKSPEGTYNNIVGAMKAHYGGTRNARSERSKFRSVFRKVLEEESVASYSVRLKQASRHCAFGVHLEQQLVDQFVAGVR